MEPEFNERLEDLFVALMDLDPSEHAHFLSEVRNEKPDLADRLEEMAGNFKTWDEGVMDKLEPKAIAQMVEDTGASTLTHQSSDGEPEPSSHASIPREIGGYRILDQIGQGGMGHVFLAEQESPRRKVALKLISSAYSTAAARQRFRSEYQAQAMMKHQNIAQLIEAGTTRRGETFFTMEYLEGQPITTYCRENNLSPLERLGLFRQVCRGVQHAHQRAILHRDLKPSNVLVVTTKDGPLAKIIDFGLAKSLTARDEFSELTHHGQLIGTPIYMSPEQINGQPMDTRGDIYTLGVLLYELLAQRHPLNKEALKECSLNEVLQVCSREEPPLPSVRIREAVAEGSATKKDYTGIVGDLDQITMKAMSKDLERRYSTVAGLIHDIDNFMANRPVSARPPSMLYLASGFFKRNKLLVSASVLALTALIVGLSIATIYAIRAEAALKRNKTTVEFLEDVFASPDPRHQGPRALVVDLLDGAGKRLQSEERDPELIGSLGTTLGRTYFGLATYEKAQHQLEQALRMRMEYLGEDHRDTSLTRYHLALTLMRQKLYQEAMREIDRTIEFQMVNPGPEDPATLRSKACKAMVLRYMERHKAAQDLYEEVLAVQQAVLASDDPDTARTLVGLGNTFFEQKAYAAAESTYHKALAIQESNPMNPETLVTCYQLGKTLHKQGRYQDAEALLEETVKDRREVLGPVHHLTVETRNLLARCYYDQKQYDRAEETFLELLEEGKTASQEPALKGLLLTRNRLAMVYYKTGRTDKAIEILREVQNVADRYEWQNEFQVLRAQHNLGSFLHESGNVSAALESLQRAFDGRIETSGLTHSNTLSTWSVLAKIYAEQVLDEDGVFISSPWFIAREIKLDDSKTLNSGLAYAIWLIGAVRFHEADVILDKIYQIACREDRAQLNDIEKALVRLERERYKNQ